MKYSPNLSSASVLMDSLAPPDVPYRVKLVVVSEDDDATYTEVELVEPVGIDCSVSDQTVNSWGSGPVLTMYTDTTYTVSCKAIKVTSHWMR